MTPWHYRWLCEFAYINLPGNSQARQGQSLRELCRELAALDEQKALGCGELSEGERETLRMIRETPELGGLRLVEFINRNGSTGLAAYVLQAEDGSVHCIFRGSESPGCGVPTGIDWLDNFLAPFLGSVQYREIEALAGRFPEGEVVFSGHSKGAHNALYALAASPNERAEARVFNGQGFAPGQISGRQREKLAGRGINYVTRGDIVGVLLWHPERRIFVKKEGKVDAHALAAFCFDRAGEPIPAMRTLWSAAIEWGTKRYWRSVKLRTE